ncbi:uncharacterized protein LOC128987515 [Macrosteles quadrilineatus]|uniref:uncharacterized protein LOC128987515 n=1 Tax=Macrosteles quadrilineatus TaxID=74068 RepID=UPI0023E0DFC0|nr:uncharacterized protein LOC128987515 [Macrosteles quadrilineatus]
MESLRKIFALAVVLSVVCSTFARVFVYDEGRAGSQIARTKRQVSKEYTFDQNNAPILEWELQRSPRALRQNVHTRWGLGYDPSDILRPPSVDRLEPAESQYRTLRVLRRPEVENPKIIYGTVKQGAVVSRPQRSSPEGSPSSYERDSSQDEEEDEEEEDAAGYSQEGHSYHQVPASIYSFVKTDPHGNFKWGVHRGPPTRG